MKPARLVLDVTAETVTAVSSPATATTSAIAVSDTSPGAHALTPWRVELQGGEIVIGETAVHPVVARDLWRRLGELLGEAERAGEQADWSRLASMLNQQFRGAVPAQGRTLARPSATVHGLALRETDDTAILRIATFSIATLKQTRAGWEGPAWSIRPNGFDRVLRPLGYRVRVPEGAIPAPRALPALPGPAPRPRSSAAPREPAAPAGLLERRRAIADVHARILAAFREVGAVLSLGELDAAVKLPREVLRAELETLVDAGELAVRKADNGERSPGWIRLEREALRPAFSRRGATRLAKGPRRKPPSRAKVTNRPPKAPQGPAVVTMRCGPCERENVRVPLGRVADARCQICGCALSQP